MVVVVVVVVAVAEVLMVVMVITALKIHPQPPKLLLSISRKWGVYIKAYSTMRQRNSHMENTDCINYT